MSTEEENTYLINILNSNGNIVLIKRLMIDDGILTGDWDLKVLRS